MVEEKPDYMKVKTELTTSLPETGKKCVIDDDNPASR